MALGPGDSLLPSCSGSLCEVRPEGSPAPRTLPGAPPAPAAAPSWAALAPFQPTGRTRPLTFSAGLASPRHQHPPPSHGAAARGRANRDGSEAWSPRKRGPALLCPLDFTEPAPEMVKCHRDHMPRELPCLAWGVSGVQGPRTEVSSALEPAPPGDAWMGPADSWSHRVCRVPTFAPSVCRQHDHQSTFVK